MTSNWRNRIIVCDAEVFKEDWLFCFKFKENGRRISFHNNPEGLKQFINNYKDTHIFCGHNIKGYDQYILRAIVSEDGSNHFVKEINDWIISGKQGWQYNWKQRYFKLNICDTLLDIVPRKSLKELEFNMGFNIQESDIPFTLDRKLTPDELASVRGYCWNDVDACEALFEARSEYFDTKVTLCTMKNFDLTMGLKMTNAQLVAEFLDVKQQDFSKDAYEYEFPACVDQRYLTPQMKNFFLHKLRPPSDGFDESWELVDDFKTPKLELLIAGVPHTLGIGGIHGARKQFHFESNHEWIILNSDVASYYPAMAILFKFLSRALNLDLYTEVRDQRIVYKKTDKAKANAFKLVLNTAYGISLAKFSKAFDTRGGRSICITGQALLIMLIGMLEDSVGSFKLIQSNTDGIMFAIKRTDRVKAQYFLDKWCAITGLVLETEEIKQVHQRDVNNYVYEDFQGKIKAKGGVTAQHAGGDWKTNNIAVVDKAVVNYFIKGVPVKDTIEQEQDVRMFQLLGRSGSTYQGTVIANAKDIKRASVVQDFINGDHTLIQPVQKTNRLYAKKGIGEMMFKFKEEVPLYDQDGTPYLLSKEGKRKSCKKAILNGKVQKFDKVSNCPNAIIIDNSGTQTTLSDIDYNYYIDLANKRIAEFYE